MGPLGHSSRSLRRVVESFEQADSRVCVRHRARCSLGIKQYLPQRRAARAPLRPAPRRHAQPRRRLLRSDRHPPAAARRRPRRQEADHPRRVRRPRLDDHPHGGDRRDRPRGLRLGPGHRVFIPGLFRRAHRFRLLRHEPGQRRHDVRRRCPGREEPRRQDGRRLRPPARRQHAVGHPRRPPLPHRPQP